MPFVLEIWVLKLEFALEHNLSPALLIRTGEAWGRKLQSKILVVIFAQCAFLPDRNLEAAVHAIRQSDGAT